MNKTETTAIAEVLQSYFEPDSPEGLACAMYELRRIYNDSQEEAARRKARRRRETSTGHPTGCCDGATGTGRGGEIEADRGGERAKRGWANRGVDSEGEILKQNVEVHTSATGGADSTQVEGCSGQPKSDSERVADCGATPCSISSFLDGREDS